jgi:hypothetical protein
MMVEIQLWHMVTLLLSFFGAVWAFWQYVKGREDKGQDTAQKALDTRFNAIERDLEQIKHSPVMNDLPAQVREMRACQNATQDALNVMRTSLLRIEDFLLNRRN